MFEKLAEDVSTRYQEKLADILSNRMDIEDWLTGTLEERNRYADSLGEGNYQLFNLGGKPYPAIGQGEESIVYPAIGSTRNGKFKMKDQWMPNYNFVAKTPNIDDSPIANIIRKLKGLDRQLVAKKDLQNNSKNLWLPFNDFEGGENKNMHLSERLSLVKPSNFNIRQSAKDLNTLLRNSAISKNISNAEQIKKGDNLLGIPMVAGKSGKPYSIYDFGLFIDKNKAPKFRNLAFDSDNKLKIMDYLVNVFEKGRKQ